MLPVELLRYRAAGDEVQPAYVDPASPRYLGVAEALIALAESHVDSTLGEFREAVRDFIGGATDHRLQRGLAHLLEERLRRETPDAATPGDLRRALYTLVAERGPIVPESEAVGGLTYAAAYAEVGAAHALAGEEVARWLFADHPEGQRIVDFDQVDLTPQWLLARYNLALAQGLLYRADELTVTLFPDPRPGYQRVFYGLKRHRLLYTCEGNPDLGWDLQINGLGSIHGRTHYGVRMAAFLPYVLLHPRWQLHAVTRWDGARRALHLTDESGLVSYLRPSPAFDSILERELAERFAALSTDWQLVREMGLIPLGGSSVMIPDFRAVYAPDPRVTAYFEIVGYTGEGYLERKIAKVRRAGRRDLLLAVGRHLNLDPDVAAQLPSRVFFYRDEVRPRPLLRFLEQYRATLDEATLCEELPALLPLDG
jgi:predicted nuclease of restriction endonuclease-like RecB superfamily